MRKILMVLVVAAIVLGAFVAWGHFSKGTIIVSTDNQENIIEIVELTKDGKDANKFSIENTGNITTKVPVGKYRITVSGKAFATSKTVDVGRGKVVQLEINPQSASAPEPVTSIIGNGITASSSHVYYLSAITGKLTKITNNGQEAAVSELVLDSVEWISPGNGIAMSRNGELYSVVSDTVKPIPLSRPSGQTPVITYSAANDQKLFVSIGADVYSGSPGGGLKKIYTSSAPAVFVSASKDNFAVVNRPTFGGGHDGEEESGPFVEIVSSDGKRIARKNIEAFRAKWSPDGSKLSTVNYHGKSGIFDKNLEQIATPPANDINYATWIDNETLLYASESNLWSYSLSAGEAKVLANFTPGTVISEIYYDQAAAYAYLLLKSEDKADIRRVGLKSQKTPEHLLTLDVVLPKTIGSCYITYVNITSPIIVVRYPAGTPPTTCQKTAQDDLTRFRVDISKFQFKTEVLQP